MYDIEFVNGKKHALFEQNSDVHIVMKTLARCMVTSKIRSEHGSDYVDYFYLKLHYKKHNLQKLLDCLKYIGCCDATVTFGSDYTAHSAWRLTDLGLHINKILRTEALYLLPL